jgi:RNA polymerase subunit RPABC4/transcription elongation factor Spt4
LTTLQICPLCKSSDVEEKININFNNKLFCMCRRCGCNALKDNWQARIETPYELFGYYVVIDGETHFTSDRKKAEVWYDFGHQPNALFEKVK